MILLLVPLFVVAGIVSWIKIGIDAVFRRRSQRVDLTGLDHLDPYVRDAFIRMRTARSRAGMV